MTPPLTLALEASTYEGSVALIRGSEVIAEETLRNDQGGTPSSGRGERLVPAVQQCLAAAGVTGQEIARIVCGAGPGRFTSLRIAGSAAKGMAVGFGVDLYAVSSLVLTLTGTQPAPQPGEYLSVLDAMRGDWFMAHLTLAADGTVRAHGPPRLVSTAELGAIVGAGSPLRVIGPGQTIDAHPHARGVAPLLSRIVADGPVDLAAWEPDYGRLPEAQVRREAASGSSAGR